MRENKKNICVIVHNYFPYTETRVLRQVESLKALYNVDIICLKKNDDKQFERFNGLNIYRIPVKYKRSLLLFRLVNVLHFFILAYFKLNGLSRKINYSVVHIHTHINFLVFIGIKQKIKGVPLILDMHDLLPEFFQGRFQNSFFKSLYRLAYIEESISCHFADHIIVVTTEAKEALIQRKIKSEKLNVIMNLADNKKFSKVDVNRKSATIGLDLLYYGSLIWFYGIDVAIKGVSLAIKTCEKVTLSVYGAGHQKEYLIDLVERLHLNDNVFIKDPIPPEEIRLLIDQNVVGILPSVFNKHTEVQLPTKLLEYASMEIPVLCSRIPILETYFNSDLVEYFKSGSPVDFSRAIQHLCNSQKRKTELSKKIALFNKKYNWAKEERKLLSIYEGIANT